MLYAMDHAWWTTYLPEAREVFKGQMVGPFKRFAGVQCAVSPTMKNSGAGAIALAVRQGARRIILLGYDAQKTGGKAHWHGDHPEGLGNAGSVDKWPGHFSALAKDLHGIEVINCSRQTALDAFPLGDLEAELSITKLPALYVQGMHGMGDNLHQRAIIRALMKRYEVWLETPWPSVYHDFDDLHLVSKGSQLRTQAKNVTREARLFETAQVPATASKLDVSYPPALVRQYRGVLAAMSAKCGTPLGDFRMPVPDTWTHGLDLPTDKPVLVYRPLVERAEWGGCPSRNPDLQTYLKIFESIREQFFVVSIADLEPGREWLAQPDITADITLHQGQLTFTQLAALWRDAALVMSSPGFGVALAQAVGTPVVAVFGGYEAGYSFSAGARYTPTLTIQPVRPCDCFSHTHNCDKRIAVPAALKKLKDFVHDHCPHPAEHQAVAA